MLLKVWQILSEGGPSLGIRSVSGLGSTPSVSWKSDLGVPITPTDKIQILGVPLGSASFTEEFVKDSLLGITDGVMSKLIEFEDTQAAIFLPIIL